MPKVNYHILSTRPLSKKILDEALDQGLVIEEASFIETEAIVDESLQKGLETFWF